MAVKSGNSLSVSIAHTQTAAPKLERCGATLARALDIAHSQPAAPKLESWIDVYKMIKTLVIDTSDTALFILS